MVLFVSNLCTKLNIRQIEMRTAQLKLDTAKKEHEKAEVDLDNSLYIQWINQIQYKDVENKEKFNN